MLNTITLIISCVAAIVSVTALVLIVKNKGRR